MAEEIKREDIKQALVKGDVILVEALPEKYYREGHLPNAIQINHNEVATKASQLLPNKDALIVTYCTSDTCPNSGYAADHLIDMGYTNVKKYVGGKKDWTGAGEVLEGV